MASTAFKTILYYNDNNKFVTLQYKTSWTVNGVEHIQYTNALEDMIAYSKVNSNVINFQYEETKLTTEQNTRLSFLNTLGIDKSEAVTYISEFSAFVTFGYIAPNTITKLKPYTDKYEATSKAYLLNFVTGISKNLRKAKENAGVGYKGYIVDTDREAQASITSLVSSFSTGLCTSTTFKMQNDEYYTISSLTEMLNLAATVLAYVQACYTAEGALKVYLSGLTTQELMVFLSDTENTKLSALYQEQFSSIYADMLERMKANLSRTYGTISSTSVVGS